MYKDTNNTESRAKELACDVGITVDIARIFTSRIPEESEEFSKKHDRKKNNYLKIWHILEQISNLKGLLDANIAFEAFLGPAKRTLTEELAIPDTPEFKRFAVLDCALHMKFPREVKKSELADEEISALYDWLTGA